MSPLCHHLNGDNETNIPIGSSASLQSSESCSLPCTQGASNNQDVTRQQTSSLESNFARNSENQTNVQTQPLSTSNPRSCPLSGIVFERPKYPSYSVIATRISSFQNWPSYLTQTPRNLSTAGFFYLGHGDHVRCFFCGGICLIH